MWAYAMIATGLLNWDYQRATPNIVAKSLVIIIPGALLLAITFIPAARQFLLSKGARAAIAFVGIAALAYAFLN